MQVEVLYQPEHAVARVSLAAQEALKAASSALMAMSPGVQVTPPPRGGLLQSAQRGPAERAAFSINTYQAGPQGAELWLAPALPGDVQVLDLDDAAWLVPTLAYVAAEPTVTVTEKWGGAQSFFPQDSLSMLRCAGPGRMLVASYGAFHALTLAAGESYAVATGHLVALSAALGYNIRVVDGYTAAAVGGIEWVADLRGPGRVLLQTRDPQTLFHLFRCTEERQCRQ